MSNFTTDHIFSVFGIPKEYLEKDYDSFQRMTNERVWNYYMPETPIGRAAKKAQIEILKNRMNIKYR